MLRLDSPETGGMALVQTVDILTPVVNDPHLFGRIAAANALSDVYAMGGRPLCAMNIVCYPAKAAKKEGRGLGELRAILAGGLEAVLEAGAAPAGGHSVEDDAVKYGLAVSGLVDPGAMAVNGGLAPGDVLVLTKPLGTGILATALKAAWPGSEGFEALIGRWAGRLNDRAAKVIREFGLRAATDVTGFGLIGHALEMARASRVVLELTAAAAPVMPEALDMASQGLTPEGGHANRAYCRCAVDLAPGLDPASAPTPALMDCLYDAQTSGGLLLGVPEAKLAAVRARLEEGGDLGAVVGHVAAAVEPPEQGRIIVT